MVERKIAQRKLDYRARMEKLLEEYKNIILIGADNVGSTQMQQIRIALRGRAVLLMGKNTIMRKVLRGMVAKNPKFEGLIPLIVGNVGMVFTNDNLMEIRKVVLENKVPAAARAGALAPIDVMVPAGPTGLDPGQTSFFQVLNIATKIVKGSIEIITPVHLIKAGDKVTPSHVSLLGKLDIRPFFYGMKTLSVYEDGSIYDANVLDLTDDDLLAAFYRGVTQLATISLAIGVPSLASLPHSFARAFKNMLAIAAVTDITFKEAEEIKAFLADPSAFAAAAAAAGGGGGGQQEEEKKEEEEEEESDADMLGGGLFGDDSD